MEKLSCNRAVPSDESHCAKVNQDNLNMHLDQYIFTCTFSHKFCYYSMLSFACKYYIFQSLLNLYRSQNTMLFVCLFFFNECASQFRGATSKLQYLLYFSYTDLCIVNEQPCFISSVEYLQLDVQYKNRYMEILT